MNNIERLKEGIKVTPYNHQLEAVDFFSTKNDGCLLFEMGTGKTGTAILTYRNWCRREGRMLRCLVVAPSVVLHNWKDEFKLFSHVSPDLIFPLTRGSGKDKAEKVYSDILPVLDGTIISVNYEALLNEDLFLAIEKWNPEIIIFDEVHYLKNSAAKRSKLCIRLAERSLYRLGLTGTAILRNSMDIFGIFRAVDLGKTFGTNKFVFQSKYLLDKNARNPNVSFPNWVDNPSTYKELNEKIYKKSLRKLKSECLDLPDLIKILKYAEWGVKQKRAYTDLKREFLTFVESKTKEGEHASITANLAITKALRMLQVASGFVMTDDGIIHEFDDVPRLDLVEELLNEIVVEENNKCILWCSYKHNYKMLAKVCDKLKIKYVFMTGEQNTNEKRESEVAFQKDPSVKVIIANRGAGGIGVNLTAASYSIVYSRNFSLAEELQSEARNHRGGSEVHDKIVKIDLCIKDSIEEAQLQALKNKHQISTDILDMIKKEE
jgi:SNF2 family DNA or RNA helicase